MKLQPLSYVPALLVLLALGGCASTEESAPDWAGVKGDADPAKLGEFKETARFEVRWHSKVADSGAEILRPTLTRDAIYSASGKGVLIRLDRASGQQVWTIQTGMALSSGAMAGGEGMVLVGGSKGAVLAYDEQGQLRWKGKVSSEVLSFSPVVDGVVLVRSGDGKITCLSAEDGKRLWVYERSTPALVVRSHAGMTVRRGIAYVGFAGGKLAAISLKDGEVLWEAIVSLPRGNTELERISDIISEPVVDDQQVCAVAFQGRVACFDISQGSPLWNRDISSDKGMTVLQRYFYLTDANGAVFALDKITGSTAWKNSQLLARGVTAPVALGDFIVAGDSEGYLHGLKREDGSFAARIKLESGAVTEAPLEMDGGLLVQTRGGELYSLSIK